MRLSVLNVRSTPGQLEDHLRALNSRMMMDSWNAVASCEIASPLGTYTIYVQAPTENLAHMAKGFVLGAFFGTLKLR